MGGGTYVTPSGVTGVPSNTTVMPVAKAAARSASCRFLAETSGKSAAVAAGWTCSHSQSASLRTSIR